MINLLQNLDDSFSNSFKSYNNINSLLLTEKENSFFLPLDESPIIKSNKSNKNLFITRKTMKEKIEHQKMKLGLDHKSIKEIILNKKEDLKRRNRESAQNSRNKKKLEFIKLIEENKMLKDKIYIINSKISLLCSHCKNFFELNQPINNNNIIKNNDNNIELEENLFNNTHNTQSSSFFANLKIQKLFNFMLISLFTLICIFCFILDNNINNHIIRKNQENLNETELNISLIKNDSVKYNKENTEEKINENNFFNSFQCKKKSFASMMLDEFDNNKEWNTEKENNNIEDINKEKKGENKIKNPIYFKLFIQSCSLEEEPESNNNKDNKDNNSFNDNKHYVFSTDKTSYRDFYFFCQEIDN